MNVYKGKHLNQMYGGKKIFNSDEKKFMTIDHLNRLDDEKLYFIEWTDSSYKCPVELIIQNVYICC